MTNIWEQNIKEWYEKSDTSRLSYLDLANTEKPSTKELAHNIAVIYDRVCLSSKVNLKEFRSQQIQVQSLETSVQQLAKKVNTKLFFLVFAFPSNLDFCREIPIPGYYKEPEKKFEVKSKV